ncbi:MAG: fumarylacetoacetase [Candidatus Velthaea sp.]
MRPWLASAAAGDFGLNNLPLGIFSRHGDAPRAGVAIGDRVCDVSALVARAIVDEPSLRAVPALNAFLARGRARWTALRQRLQHLFGEAASPAERSAVESELHGRADVTLHLPIAVGDYVDFYSSIEHATNVGRLFRPSDPLLPNYRHIPIGYHGRAATVVVDGTTIRRPSGQTKAANDAAPVFGPTRQLDYELELGFVIGPGNADGAPIPVERAREHVYGYVLLNDWSARDMQSWEYQPLGPFLSKSFATSISPWLVSLDALEPFRVDNREQDPPPLPYLRTSERWAYDIALEVRLQSRRMRAADMPPATVARTNFRAMYWHLAQQLAHLTSNGSIVRPGDLCGSGTVSGSQPGTYGSLLELTVRGTHPLELPGGESRAFLDDGDTVILSARAERDGVRVGFGDVRGTIAGAA